MDVETGFFETTDITGEGIDKGDKAGYKAYTGALKYFLADTFMVATGDDPESESPEAKMNNKKIKKGKATEKQIELIRKLYTEHDKLLDFYGIQTFEELSMEQASQLISNKKGSNNG